MTERTEGEVGPMEPLVIGHITVQEKPGDRIDASCSECGQGIDIGATFGVIPGQVLLAEWMKQHVHKPKAKRPGRQKKEAVNG